MNRNGQLIMVDDDRMKLKPGEKVETKMVRFLDSGLLSADRWNGIGSHDLRRDHRGDIVLGRVGADQAVLLIRTEDPPVWKKESGRAIFRYERRFTEIYNLRKCG